MRIAKVREKGKELLGIEYSGQFYRVDRLDEILDCPLPQDVRSLAAHFEQRVFSLVLAGLSEYEIALRQRAYIRDASVFATPPFLLPPTRRDPLVLELPEAAVSDDTLRINGRALLGSKGVGLLSEPCGPLWVAPAVAAVVGEDLHMPTLKEVRVALLGYCLGLAWSLQQEEEQAVRNGLGPAPGREIGTHLGASLTVASAMDADHPVPVRMTVSESEMRQISLHVHHNRMCRALVRAGRFGDIYAGDVILFVSKERMLVQPGQEVCVECDWLGSLVGRMGGAPGLRH